MTIKKRPTNRQTSIENLANELADKPYGEDKKVDTIARTTITLPTSILFQLEDMAKANKRNKKELRSVSAIIRHCIQKTLHI